MRRRPPPHDTPAGPNPDVRNLRVEVLSDAWYTLRRATFEQRQPDGTWAETSREAYDRGNGACALLHDPDRDTILLVRQYRLPAHLNGHPDGMLLEVPAGLLDGGDAAEGERLEVVEVTLDEAAAMIADGRICDAKTVLLVEWARRRGQ